ncbi:hypothetical protein AWM75_02440 [Aerococcus urinaehominis]|uniref:Uncharacterized protein n=1 Tax=Aerococcus urinaehominis TaxID=128944 RepID=A0A109RHI7_9LACT|nr:YfhO family protein [Aerococcus urinaehominis]AMB98921.1 hypothetical protein AWM75_02440 [Aerococcus urinaehominis]SDM39647.1 Uncharacterized membrane protein YfhO [Aerococcus urinaehominis]
MSLKKALSKFTCEPKTILLLSFLLPFLIVGLYFITSGVFPFGDQTPYTVDLGQQYIDFFRYYQNTLRGSWDQIFYSFQKGYGGEMVGTWSYYLMSPFMVLLLFFPQNLLTVAVTLIISLKIASISLTFQLMLGRLFKSYQLTSLAFSLIYGLCGFVSANHFNLMWLDGLIFLPLVVMYLEELLAGRRAWPYVLSLAALIISNYYIGYMVCLFLILYFIYYVSRYLSQTNFSWRHLGQQAGRFAGYSLISAGLTAWLLLPTWQALSASKTANTHIDWDFSLAYPPAHLLSKLVIGPFNFDQMPEGLPNIYMGSLAIIALATYFTNRKIAWIERLTALIIVSFLLLSMNLKALDMVWHGFQYPIWYPYRFSFVFVFMVALLGFRSLLLKPAITPRFLLIIGSLLGLALTYLAFNIQEFSYLHSWALILTCLAYLACLSIFALANRNMQLASLALLALTTGEMAANTVASMDSISYLSHSEVSAYIQATQPLIDQVQAQDPQPFYRLQTSMERTKNDPMQLAYFGLSHFNSTLEQASLDFFGQLGQPTTSGAYAYTNGSLIMDALFGLKYLARPNSHAHIEIINQINSQRADLASYPQVAKDNHFTIQQNPNALGLVYAVPAGIKDFQLTNQPIINQDQILDLMMGRAVNQTPVYQLNNFQVANFSRLRLENIRSDNDQLVNTFYRRNPQRQGEDLSYKIHLDIIPASDQAYYLTLPGDLDEEDVAYYLNGEPLAYEKSYQTTQVINIANGQKGEQITFTIEVLKDTIQLSDLNLYSLDGDIVNEMASKLSSQAIQIGRFNNQQISGQLKNDANHPIGLMTVPYSDGWTIKDHGQIVDSFPIFEGAWLGFDLSQAGDHQLEISYWPPGLNLGIAISVLSLLILLSQLYLSRRSNH